MIVSEKNGWFTVEIEGLRFPECCVDCGGAAQGWFDVEGHKWDWLTSVFTLGMIYSAENVWLKLPICDECPLRTRRRGGIWGAALGALAGALIGGFIYWKKAESVPAMWLMIPILAPIFAVAGFLFGSQNTYAPPVQVKKFSPTKRTIMIRFDRPDFAELFRGSDL